MERLTKVDRGRELSIEGRRRWRTHRRACFCLAGLALALVAPAAGQAPSASAAEPPDLTGEGLWARPISGGPQVGSVSVSQHLCVVPAGAAVTLSVTGPTRFGPLTLSGTEPYPGAYGLQGAIEVGPVVLDPPDPYALHRTLTTFSGRFHIDSAAGEVDGRYALAPGVPGTVQCTTPLMAWSLHGDLVYSALIRPPGGGLYLDRGRATVDFSAGHRGSTFFESFVSGLGATLPQPQVRRDCKAGGWRRYGTQFRNQGQCIAYVNSGSAPPPWRLP